MFGKKRREYEEGSEDATVEIYATHELGMVTLYLAYVEPGHDHEAVTLAVKPDIAYNLAQRLTMAAMKIEEGPE